MFENNAKPDNSVSEKTPTDSLSALWLKIIGLAIAYLIAGKLSYFSTISTNYDSPIWLASGIGLAGILAYGYRIWPGVFLGAFLINALILEQSASLTENINSALIALVVSSGATLQALWGAYLIKRFTDFPNALLKGKQVFLFFFYGGTIAALVNATLSVATLVATERIPVTAALSSWAVWWAGDFLGIFIFTPLALVWLLPHFKGLHHKRLILTLPIIALLLLTATATFWAKKYNNEKINAEINEHGLIIKSALERSMIAQLNTLYSLERFFASSERVERKEFHNLVAHYLDEMPSIRAIAWDPVIKDSARAAFELSVQAEGYPHFQITESDVNQKMIPAWHRPIYLPVAFIEPMQGNEAALGFDNYSMDSRRLAFDQARDSGDIVITAPIQLIQGDKGIVSMVPIYLNSVGKQSLAERRANIVGYVVIVFQLKDIIPESIYTPGLAYQLIDKESAPGQDLIFSRDWETVNTSDRQEGFFLGKRASSIYESSFRVGERVWHLKIVPSNAWLLEHGNYYTQLALMLGLMLTGLLGAIIWAVSGRESVIQAFFQERLASLEKIEEQMQVQLDLKDRLQKKQDMLNKLFLQIPGVVYQFKCSPEEIYSFPFINEGVNEIYELSVDQASMAGSKAVFDRIHPDDYKKVIESIEISRRTLQLWRQEYRVVLPDKGVRWLLGVARPEQLVDGSVLWHGFINDITERVQDEETLKKEKDKFHTLFELSPIGMALVDKETGHFLEANNRVLEDTGYSKDEFLNLSFWDITPREYEEQEAQQLLELNEKGCFGPNEKEYIRKDGTRYPIAISGFKYVDINGVEVVWGFIQDITKLKELDALVLKQALDEVRHNQHIAHLDRQRSLGIMSASLGHELKQPLAAILTNAQVAKRGLNKEVLTLRQVEAFLDKIIHNTKRSSLIIDKIRGFIEPSSLERFPVDIGKLADSTIKLLAQDLMTKHIDVQFSIEDSRMLVLADEIQLSQVLINMYRNAIEAVEHQKIRRIDVSVKAKDKWVVICIRDSGPGLSPESLQHISEPYYTTKTTGLGLGLSISRSIVEQYGGHLIISNAEEGGAMFEIQFPQFLNEFCLNCTECDDK
jgi:PAS domain S-box-containing protein